MALEITTEFIAEKLRVESALPVVVPTHYQLPAFVTHAFSPHTIIKDLEVRRFVPLTADSSCWATVPRKPNSSVVVVTVRPPTLAGHRVLVRTEKLKVLIKNVRAAAWT